MIPPAIRIALDLDWPGRLAAAVILSWSDVNHVGVVLAARAEFHRAAALGWQAVDKRNLLFRHDFVLAAIAADFEGGGVTGFAWYC